MGSHADRIEADTAHAGHGSCWTRRAPYGIGRPTVERDQTKTLIRRSRQISKSAGQHRGDASLLIKSLRPWVGASSVNYFAANAA